MKVLIVSFAFPPSNVIGAIRVGKLARFLDHRGHDVRVLTTDTVEDRSLPLEISRERVVYTNYREDRNRLGKAIGRFLLHRPAAPAGAAAEDVPPGSPAKRSFGQIARRHYFALRCIPDMRAGWLKTAVSAGRRLIEQWRPDIIFASAPPYTGLIVASRLARGFAIPWLADLRDLWVDNPYYSEPGWRKAIDAVVERETLKSAARLVTVSPIWAEQLHRRHAKPVVVVYNGYAKEDFPPIPNEASDEERLTIRYMGSIYPGFRDPSALFAAIARLPEAMRARVTVEFFCDLHQPVLAAAATAGIADAVVVKPLVPYRRALELQTRADVLLLLQSCEQRDVGNIPAKLFEYLYARRPILFIGYQHGIAAHLVRERSAGLVSNSPAEICRQLQTWIADKHAGSLKALDLSVCLGLSRDEQYRKLEDLLAQVLAEVAHSIIQPAADLSKCSASQLPTPC
jgi:glycosyltransferase involved in cell wall biosynthesis